MTTRPALRSPDDTAYSLDGPSARKAAGAAVDGAPPLVFIHGVGMQRAVWAPQVAAFADSRQVVTYDTLGHGDSPMVPQGARLEPYYRQLLGLCDHLGLARIDLVGHSMGAVITIGFALAHPERVRRIVPMTGVYDRTPEHRARALATAELLAEKGPEAVIETTLGRWFSDPDRQDPARLQKLEQLRAWLLAVDRVGYARAYRTFAENGEAFVGRLGQLQPRALFMTAQFDPNSTPEMSRAMAEASPRGEALVIADERHMLPFVAPEKVNPPIEAFLSGASSDD